MSHPPINFVFFADEKSTMTGDPVESTSNEGEGSSGVIVPGCSIELRDRTSEMINLMNLHTVETAANDTNDRKITFVDALNPLPVKDYTHMVPIGNRTYSGSEEPNTLPAVLIRNGGGNPPPQKPSNSARQQPAAKKKGRQQQQKQMTKKQRKAIEAGRMKNQQGGCITPPRSEEIIVAAVDSDLQVHQFQTFSRNPCKDGEMIVRGTNTAAKAVCGEAAVSMPYIRPGDNVGNQVLFSDLHSNSQKRYLAKLNSM